MPEQTLSALEQSWIYALEQAKEQAYPEAAEKGWLGDILCETEKCPDLSHRLPRFVESFEKRKLLDVLQQHLPSSYTDLSLLTLGGTKAIFHASYGGEQRILKIDRFPKNPHAYENMQKGYTVRHEHDILQQLPEGQHHHLTWLLDSFSFREHEKEYFVLVEPSFVSQPLLFVAAHNSPYEQFSLSLFPFLFSQIFDAVCYIYHEGFYHRDLSPSNILISDDRKNLDVRIVDFANTVHYTAEQSPLPFTTGSRTITDPFSVRQTNFPLDYLREQGELYSLGKNMLYTLLGKTWSETSTLGIPLLYDPLSLSVFMTTPRLPRYRNMDEDYTGTLGILLSNLPPEGRPFTSIIHRCLILDQKERYSSLLELVEDFQRCSS